MTLFWYWLISVKKHYSFDYLQLLPLHDLPLLLLPLELEPELLLPLFALSTTAKPVEICAVSKFGCLPSTVTRNWPACA
jgi:hypothetical protein